MPQLVNWNPTLEHDFARFTMAIHGSVHRPGPIISILSSVLAPSFSQLQDLTQRIREWIHCHFRPSTLSQLSIPRSLLTTTLMRRYATHRHQIIPLTGYLDPYANI